MTAELVVSTFYDLRDAEAFDRAARYLLARLRLTGMEGVRSYRFLGAGPRERRLVAIYDSAEVWKELQDRIAPWAESAALRAAARVARVDVYGTLSPPMRDWADQLGLGRRLRLVGGTSTVVAAAQPDRTTVPRRSLFQRLAGG